LFPQRRGPLRASVVWEFKHGMRGQPCDNNGSNRHVSIVCSYRCSLVSVAGVEQVNYHIHILEVHGAIEGLLGGNSGVKSFGQCPFCYLAIGIFLGFFNCLPTS